MASAILVFLFCRDFSSIPILPRPCFLLEAFWFCSKFFLISFLLSFRPSEGTFPPGFLLCFFVPRVFYDFLFLLIHTGDRMYFLSCLLDTSPCNLFPSLWGSQFFLSRGFSLFYLSSVPSFRFPIFSYCFPFLLDSLSFVNRSFPYVLCCSFFLLFSPYTFPPVFRPDSMSLGCSHLSLYLLKYFY